MWGRSARRWKILLFKCSTFEQVIITLYSSPFHRIQNQWNIKWQRAVINFAEKGLGAVEKLEQSFSRLNCFVLLDQLFTERFYCKRPQRHEAHRNSHPNKIICDVMGRLKKEYETFDVVRIIAPYNGEGKAWKPHCLSKLFHVLCNAQLSLCSNWRLFAFYCCPMIFAFRPTQGLARLIKKHFVAQFIGFTNGWWVERIG